MQVFGALVRLALKHLPVPVAGDQGDLLDSQASLEEAARRLVTEVMEVKVQDVERSARPANGGSDRSPVLGEDVPGGAVCFASLSFDKSPGVEAGDVQKGNFLVVPSPGPWVPSLADDHLPCLRVNGGPLDAADFFLPHGRREAKRTIRPTGMSCRALAST